MKAQVRIGGNTAPSKAAVLDLNATDATNAGTGGLVLPRVNLTSNTMQLTTGVANVTGTLVYDVTATLGQIGVFYWNGNTWVQASLPSASAADSGKMLMSDGKKIVLGFPQWRSFTYSPGVSASNLGAVSWTKVYSATVSFQSSVWPAVHRFLASGLSGTDFCVHASGSVSCYFIAGAGYFDLVCPEPTGTQDLLVNCYRPSI